MIGDVITKTYTHVPEDGRLCVVPGVPSEDSFASTDYGPCVNTAAFCINITTRRYDGRHRVHRVGFCVYHVNSKYARWFHVAG